MTTLRMRLEAELDASDETVNYQVRTAEALEAFAKQLRDTAAMPPSSTMMVPGGQLAYMIRFEK